MQTFQSKFTTDISQHQRTMRAFRDQTCAAVQQARTELLSLGAISFGGLGLKDMIKNTIALGAEMQNTRIAFETMMGSAEKGNATIALLEKFADVTPYDNDEVIKSGRMLLNVGVATENLAKKLTMIGDIAAGTSQPLKDMVAIYAKAANKGKVQAEELAQLAERGVPIMKVLAEMLGVTTEEVMKFGSEGKLSFALLEEAFEKLTSKGGQYFGLMEKQSESLKGKWAGVEVELTKFATSIGEKAIPSLTKAVDEFLAKINEMKESGELDELAAGAAELIGQAADALKRFVAFIVENRETIAGFGMDAAKVYLFVKALGVAKNVGQWIVGFVQSAAATVDAATIASAQKVEFAEEKKRAEIMATEKLRETLAARRKMQDAKGAYSLASSAGGVAPEKMRQLSQAASDATARYRELRTSALEAYRAIPDDPPKGLRALRMGLSSAGKSAVSFGKGMGSALIHPLAGAKMAVQNFGAAASVAFAGYELGKYLGKLLNVEDALTRMILKAQGLSDAQIEDGMNTEKPRAVVPPNDLAKGVERYQEIGRELKKLEEQFLILDKAGKKAEANVLKAKIVELNKEASDLDEAARKYAQASEKAVKEIPNVQKKLKESIRKYQALEKEKPVLTGHYEIDVSAQAKYDKKVSAAYQEIRIEQNHLQSLMATRDQYRKDLTEYQKWQKQQAEKNAAEVAEQTKKQAQKESASAEFRRKQNKEKQDKELEDKKKFAQKEAEVNRDVAKAREEVTEGRRKIAVEKQRDAMSDKIAKWRKEIDGYQKDIDKTEKMLGKLGFSVDEDILKTPEQIAQEKKDERLKKKIEMANRGAKVNFTKEERDRINAMQAAQKDAREKQKKIAGNESSITGAENDLEALDKKEAALDRKNREKIMQQKQATADAMAQQLETLKKANKPMEEKLKGIEDILKKRLPGETA